MSIECFNNLEELEYQGFSYRIWAENEYCTVGFSRLPDLENKIINTSVMTAEEIKQAKKKPMYLRDSVNVYIHDWNGCNTYTFTIPAHYDYDGASIPRIFWRLIGSKENIEYRVAALIHDVICENHHYVNNNRYFADRVFDCLLKAGGACAVKRWLMFHTVDNYQKLCGWNK